MLKSSSYYSIDCRENENGRFCFAEALRSTVGQMGEAIWLGTIAHNLQANLLQQDFVDHRLVANAALPCFFLCPR